MEFTAEKGGHIIRLNGVDGGTDDGMVERLEFSLLMKDDIGGKFYLHETPVVARAEALMYWAELLSPPIESLVKLFGIQSVGKRLGPLGIGNEEKGIVRHLEGDAGFYQPLGQPIVAVEIDLQTERCPGGDSDVTEPKRLVNEIEVVMEAFS